jgi:hypothetical protein
LFDAFDLRAEAAFNLSLIYRTSGARQLAIDLLQSHCSL